MPGWIPGDGLITEQTTGHSLYDNRYDFLLPSSQ